MYRECLESIDNSIIEENMSSLNDRLIIDTIINRSQDTIYFKDLKSRFLLVNPAQTERLGLAGPSMAIGKTDFDFFPMEQAKAAFDDEQRIISTLKPILSKVEILHWPNGEISWVSVSKYPLFDADGTLIGTWGISRDITAQKNAEQELEKLNNQLNEINKNLELLSLTDPLSGLYNRRCFNEMMKRTVNSYEKRIGNGNSANFAICVVDIDLFKDLNDSFGHLAGDSIIKYVGDVLKNTIRETDIAFRYGGDEFIILFPDIDRHDARKIAERLSKSVMESYVAYDSEKINITVSIGIASMDEVENIHDLLEIADKRLYLSKRNGRNMIT